MNTRRFPYKVERVLRIAGWTGEKSDTITVRLPEGYTLFPAVEEILKEFGGLEIGHDEEGYRILHDEFYISPWNSGTVYGDPNARTEDGYRLYPFGLMCDRQGFLLVDERGHVYALFEIRFNRVAKTFDEAIIKLVLGVRFWLSEEIQAQDMVDRMAKDTNYA
ncbi:MAG: SUKH-3 domain-containing protein [Candidatus Methylacidiphilales bacterium]|nr:SUKH-3 domain-containing protein [Candidatus Methylacidiphilales bacterium]